ncbi:hypothetical protein, partial [Enterococcus sp. AZ163]|uniref:hypothetical protein n=1 Tax=Enterococcus sp. AZ163 TaxID=2774638 RepID=UPI003D26DE31
QEKLMQQLKTLERENSVEELITHQAIKLEKKDRSRRRYAVYLLTYRDGSEYLVYGSSQQTACNIVGKSENKLSKALIINKEYLSSYYLERDNGALTPLSLYLSERSRNKSYLIAEKQQTKIKASGVCFNEAPIQFFKYSPGALKQLAVFCDHLPIVKNKKFKSNGRVTVQTKRGGIGLGSGQLLIKIGQEIFFTMDKEEFEQNFVVEESLVWAEK